MEMRAITKLAAITLLEYRPFTGRRHIFNIGQIDIYFDEMTLNE